VSKKLGTPFKTEGRKDGRSTKKKKARDREAREEKIAAGRTKGKDKGTVEGPLEQEKKGQGQREKG